MTQEWVSVKERLPPTDETVLVYIDGQQFSAYLLMAPSTWYYSGTRGPAPSHWMPLPPPPEDAVRTALHMAKLAFHDYAMGYDHKYGNANEHYEDAIAAIALAEKELDK